MLVIGHLPCHIQTTLNKRRRKRKGKKEKKPTLDILDRVYTVLKSGQLSDYTHPREVDPYWNKLYMQYEYLTYLIIALEKEIEKEKEKSNIDTSYINELKEDIELLKKKRKKIFDYMYNFMIIIQGAVLKNRFYGWRRYTEEFVSMFTEQALDSITRLNFDPDKSRPSIYFYQVFWLSGIGLTKKIQNLLDKNINDEYHTTNRGSKIFSSYDDLDEEDLFNKAITKIYERYEGTKERKAREPEENKSDDVSEILTDNTELIKIDEVKEESVTIESFDDIDDETEVDEEDITITDVVHYLLKKANINPDVIYNNTNNKFLNDIGKFIKSLIKKGKIELPEKYKEVLISHGINIK